MGLDALKELSTLKIEVNFPVVQIELNRPQARNAMSFQMINELVSAFEILSNNCDTSIIVLKGAGENFCAGGDIQDLRGIMKGKETSYEEVAKFDTLLQMIDKTSQVVISCIHGATMGGGLGLVCVSDVVIAEEKARLGLPEVHLGVVPALIAPFVVQKIGTSNARQLMLLGETLEAKTAKEYGLVHYVCHKESLEETLQKIISKVRKGAPKALACCKHLLGIIGTKEADAENRSKLLLALLKGEEAQEGLQAFLQKRPAKWRENG